MSARLELDYSKLSAKLSPQLAELAKLEPRRADGSPVVYPREVVC